MTDAERYRQQYLDLWNNRKKTENVQPTRRSTAGAEVIDLAKVRAERTKK
jgi:hypothetical protein